MKKNRGTIGIFFTYGVSLSLWEKKGMLDRELSLYRKLAQEGMIVYFFTYAKEDSQLISHLAQKGIFVFQKKSKLPNILYSFLLPFFYKKEMQSCSILKTNQMLGSWTGVIAKILYRKKLIVRTGYSLSFFSKQKNIFFYIVSKAIERISIFFADAFVVATKEEEEYYKAFRQKIIRIPNFVDTSMFRPKKEYLDEKIKKILFIGRFEKQKNIYSFLRSLCNIPDIELTMVGSGSQQKEIERIIDDMSLQVVLAGNIPHKDLASFFHDADIFVLPSLYEGNPKVLLEAMSCGLPVIGTRVPGIKNLIKDNVTGVLCETDHKSLHTAVLQLAHDVDKRARLGRAASRFAQNEVSLDAVLQKEMELYSTL